MKLSTFLFNVHNFIFIVRLLFIVFEHVYTEPVPSLIFAACVLYTLHRVRIVKLFTWHVKSGFGHLSMTVKSAVIGGYRIADCFVFAHYYLD